MMRNGSQALSTRLRKLHEFVQGLTKGEEFRKALSSVTEDHKITTQEAYALADAINADRAAAGEAALTPDEYKAVATVYRTSEFKLKVAQARKDGYVTEEEAFDIAHAHNNDMLFEGREVMSKEDIKEFASYWKD